MEHKCYIYKVSSLKDERWKYILFRPCKEPINFFFTEQDNSHVLLQQCELKRFRWSRGSVVPLSNRGRGFKPGRSPHDFSWRKNR